MAEAVNIIVDSKQDKIAKQAKEEYLAGLEFKHPRTLDWDKNYDLYANKKTEGLKNRVNINLPMMSGFVDTLLSKIDNPPEIMFEPTEEADFRLVKKVNSLKTVDSSPNHGNWKYKDILSKKINIFTGRSIFQYWADSVSGYRSHLEPIDSYDFITDPLGGGLDEENHRFLGKDNINRDKWELLRVKDAMKFDPSQLTKLLSKQSTLTSDQIAGYKNQKLARFSAMGINLQNYLLKRPDTYKLVEWYTTYEGQRWYVLMDMDNDVWISIVPLLEKFKQKNEETDDAYWPFCSFASKADLFNYWSVAPADDIREINMAANVFISQAIENRNKINFGQRAYDVKMFTDPSLLEYRPDGLVPVSRTRGSIAEGIYQFETKEMGITGTIDFVKFLDNFQGVKSGVNNDTQGNSAEDKVGIYFGNLKQVADRMNLINEGYSNMYVKLGKLYFFGLLDHLKESQAVRIIGESGVEWDELTPDELKDRNLDIMIRGGSLEAQMDEIAKKKKSDFIARNIQNPLLSKRWLTEQDAKNAGFEEADIKLALDVKNEDNLEILSAAAEENQRLLALEKVEPNKAATAGHIQKHKDLAEDKKLKPEQFENIMAHLQAEMPIAVKNAARKLSNVMPIETMTGEPPIEPSTPEKPAGVPTPMENMAAPNPAPENPVA